MTVELISAFTESVRNENIVFQCIQNSGHLPGNEAMDYIIKDGLNFLNNINKIA
jgi:hypothetical protein